MQELKGQTMRTGLDEYIWDGFSATRGKAVGVVCNQATVTSEYDHILDVLLHEPNVDVRAIFGPQHGLFGHTQDNMIEWEGGQKLNGIPVYSLYGEHREPTSDSLAPLDGLVVDLPDIGTRYYTFIWTLDNCMKACATRGLKVWVLDRPNPLGGKKFEGTVLDPAFTSFVGQKPLPMRHGLTLGEIARYFQTEYYPSLDLQVVPFSGTSRDADAWNNGAPWVMPSPNMPTRDTALVYPGMCLLEGTNLSEGRGTTCPFEIFGAPWLDRHQLVRFLHDCKLPGVKFRPIEFQPTFQKFAGEICGGAFIHVLDREAFQPVLTAVAILKAARALAPTKFEWKLPPYEYEFFKLPVDILAGNEWLRVSIETDAPLSSIGERMEAECERFTEIRKKLLAEWR